MSDINLLLEENGAKARVESTNTLSLEDLAKATNQTVGEARGRDETDTGSLKRAERDRSKELCQTSRGHVDGRAVLVSLLSAHGINGLLLEELVTTKLEGTLHKVASKGRAEASRKSADTLGLDDLAEAANHAAVVLGRVELDSRLDAIAQDGEKRGPV